MADIEVLKNQLAGLESKGKELREKESGFLMLSGLESEIAKTRVKIDTHETEMKSLSEEIEEIKSQFRDIASEFCTGFAEKMNLILPEGLARVEITDESKVVIGWIKDNIFRPYEGLSGGEKSVFTAALCYALGANVLIIEAGEMDKDRLEAEVKKLSNDLVFDNVQIIINSWHRP